MYKDIVKPTLVLIIISVAVAAMLSLTYNLAGIADLGKGIKQEELDKMMPEVLPTATKLVNVKVSSQNPGLLGVYKDESGTGYAIHVTTKGYADGLVMLVGLDNDGSVIGIAIVSHGETKGIGTKAMTPEYLSKFKGLNGSVTVEKKGGDVDAIASATKSSQGIGHGVNLAFEIFNEVKEELK